jgi:hypothetical protein
MSIGSKKKDKDKDVKGASGGEASANYIIGSVGGEGRSANTTAKQEPASTTTANRKLSTREDTSDTQREAVTSQSSSPSQDHIATKPMMPGTETTTTTTSSSSTSKELPYQHQYQQDFQQQRAEQQSAITRALDETRDSIRKSTDEARRDIPRYTQATNEYHEQAIESAREIAENFLESQKEIINSLQSAWIPQIEAANRVVTSGWMSPRNFTQVYANMVSNFADNWVAASRLANNAIFANMEAFRTTLQRTRDSTKELSKININTARSLEHTARDISEGYARSSTQSGFYSTGRGGGEGYTFNAEQQQQQVPSRQNEEDTRYVMEAQNHISGEGRQQTVTDLPTAAAIGQALKDMRFPADKRRIQLFVQQQAGNNSDYQRIVSLLDKLEDRQYQNVSDVTKAAGIVE